MKQAYMISCWLIFASIKIFAITEDSTIKSNINNEKILENIDIKSIAQQNNFSMMSNLTLKINNINNAQEVLRFIPGLFIAQHAGGGKAEQIFLRGFDADHGTDIAIAVDNMAVNMTSHAHGQGYADLHFLMPELIQQINYSKGAYNPEHGDLNTAGAINLITKNVVDNMIKFEGGIYQYGKIFSSIQLLNKTKSSFKNQFFIAGSYLYNNNFFELPQKLNRLNLHSKWTIEQNNHYLFQIQCVHFNSKWNASGQIPLLAVEQKWLSHFGSLDLSEGGNTARTNISVLLNKNIATNIISKQHFYYSLYDFNLFSNFTFFLNDTTNGDQILQTEKRHLIGYQNTLHFNEYKIKKINCNTQFGFQGRWDWIENSGLYHTQQRIFVPNSIKRLGDIYISNTSFWTKQIFDFHKKINLEIALRNDNFIFTYNNKMLMGEENFLKPGISVVTISNHFSPKIILQFFGKNQSVSYLKLGKGFHSNDARLLVQKQSSNNSNSNFLPASYNIDIGKIFKLFSKTIIDFNFFYIALGQEFVYVGDENVVEPKGATRRIGAELSLKNNFNNDWFVEFDFTYTHAKFVDALQERNDIPLAPTFTSTGSVSYKKNNWQVNLNYKFLTNRPANEDNTTIAKGYCIADFIFAYHSNNNWTTSLRIENVFNTQWREAQFDMQMRIRNNQNQLSPTFNGIAYTAGTPFNLMIKIEKKIKKVE